MCRINQFRFTKCGHTEVNTEWNFFCTDPGNCSKESQRIRLDGHCFACINRALPTISAAESNLHVQAPLTEALMTQIQPVLIVLDHMCLHHKTHSSGIHAFEHSSVRVLSNYQKRVSIGDQRWLTRLEAQLEETLWDVSARSTLCKMIEGMHEQPASLTISQWRKLLLQIRWALFMAIVLTREDDREQQARELVVLEELEEKLKTRVLGLLTDLRIDRGQLSEEDQCPICYSQLLQSELGQDPQHDPVGLSCGHNFCRGCIERSLRLGNRTCPYCRKDFGLARAEFVDRLSAASHRREIAAEYPDPPTPWWIAMLRGE